MGRSSRIAGNQRTTEDKPALTESKGILFSCTIRHELLLAINKNIPQRAQRAIVIKNTALKRNRGVAAGVVEEVSGVQLA